MSSKDVEELPDAPTSTSDESTSHQEDDPQPDESRHIPISSGVNDAAIAAKRAMNGQINVNLCQVSHASFTSRSYRCMNGQCPSNIELGKVRLANKTLEAENSHLRSELKRLKSNWNIVASWNFRLGQKRQTLLDQGKLLYNSFLQEQHEKERLREERHELERKFQKAEGSVRHLQDQVTHYKANISAITRPADQTADDVIKDKFDNLFYSIQNFVVRSFREGSYEYSLFPETCKIWMDNYIPYAHQARENEWYNIAISVISSILTESFDPKYYFGVAKEPPLTAIAELITELNPGKRVETKPWFEVTRIVLDGHDPDILRQSENKLVQHMVAKVENTIAKAMQIEWTETVQKDIGRIFVSGLELFRLLHSQPSRFSLRMAPAFKGNEQRLFMPNTMEDVENLHNPEALAGCTIDISVFPLVYKIGSEENTDSISIVSRAKVVPTKKPRKVHRKRRGAQEVDSCSSRASALSQQFFYGTIAI